MVKEYRVKVVWPGPRPPRGLLITDFDGTLRRSDGLISSMDREALVELGQKNYARVIATGRSLFSYRKWARDDLPLDYLIFSSGAGLVSARNWRLIRAINLDREEISFAAEQLIRRNLDFMIHRPIPENHFFGYHDTGIGNQDFQRRITLYKDYARPLNGCPEVLSSAAQLLAVVHPDRGLEAYNEIREILGEFTVIRTTSPLDHLSVWIEIFPRTVSKSLTSSWLADQLGLTPQSVLGVGNDYNDLDFLEWAGSSYVVSNSPPDIKKRFAQVASNDGGGVAEAVGRWLGRRER